MENCFERVRHLLEKYPETRDDDVLLYYTYLHQHSKVEGMMFIWNDFLNIMRACPAPESIRRCRQKIQEGGEFLGQKRLKRLAEQDKVKGFLREVSND